MDTLQEPVDISQLATRSGVSSRTVRYYGELGLLRPSARGPGGRRLYGADACQRLRFIARLKSLGLTLDQIGELNSAFDRGATPAMLDHLDSLLARRLEEIDARVAELQSLASELRSYQDHVRLRRRAASS